MNSLQAVFWDVDGTLADTEMDGHRPAFNATFKELSLPFFWDEPLYAELLAVPGGLKRVQHHATSCGMELSTDQLVQIRDRKRTHYRRRALQGAIRIRPGVRRLLGELNARGIDQWIVTSSGRASVDALFAGQRGLEFHFNGIVTADSVPNGKPAPDGYCQARKLSGHEATSILTIEDSEAGFKASAAAGLSCLLTPSPWETELQTRFSDAAAAFDHLGDLDQPMRQLAGPPCAATKVTVEYLESLLNNRR